eukprot:jgi/Chlat1/8661/Chrsp87S08046
MIVCVAVIGPANNPIWIKCFGEGSGGGGLGDEGLGSLRFHYIVHCALDVVESRVAQQKAAKSANPAVHDPYLGLLYPTEDYRVYGYLTSSRHKLVLVSGSSPNANNGTAVDPDFKPFFRKLHSLTVDAISNPFYVAGSRIASRTYDARVSALVDGLAQGQVNN